MNTILLAFAFLITTTSSLAANERRVTVSGECRTEITPDKASITFVAESLQKNAKDAIAKATELHEKTRAALKKVKLESLELATNEYSVQERREWEKDKNVFKGYQCRIGLSATTTDIAKIGDLLAAAADAGIQDTGSLRMFMSDAKLTSEKKQCLAKAALNAREKAEGLAKSLNAKLGSVQQMTERSNDGGGGPMFYETSAAAGGMRAKSASPTIETQKQTLIQEVDVTFALE